MEKLEPKNQNVLVVVGWKTLKNIRVSELAFKHQQIKLNKKMKIVKRKISELIRAEYNPRKLTKVQEQDLKDSLTRFGLVDPILVNLNKERENIIIGGHQRVKVWESMGNTEVDCIELNLSLDKERELNIRLNKNTGSWDNDFLQDYFEDEELIEWGFTYSEFEYKDIENINEVPFPDLGDGSDSPIKTMSFTVSVDQSKVIESAIKKAKIELDCIDSINENSNGNALASILKNYIDE